MARYSTADQELAQKLQKEYKFTVVSMRGQPKIYTFDEGEMIVMEKLQKETPVETKIEIVKPEIVQVKKPPVFIKHRGRPKSK